MKICQVRNAVQNLTLKKKATASIVRRSICEPVNFRKLQNVMQPDEKLLYKRVAKNILLQCQKDKRVRQIRDWFMNRIDFERAVFSDEVIFFLDGPNNMMTWQIPRLVEGFFRHKRCFNGGGLLVHRFLDFDELVLVILPILSLDNQPLLLCQFIFLFNSINLVAINFF